MKTVVNDENDPVVETKRPYEQPRIEESGFFENLLVTCVRVTVTDCEADPQFTS
jgi:hypothetical protein